jgi:hypothetical protein
MVEPIEDIQEIGERLIETEVGDELTVETNRPFRINREITFATLKESGEYEIFVGEPERTHLLLYVDEVDDEFFIDAYTLTDDPGNPIQDKGDVEKVWFW